MTTTVESIATTYVTTLFPAASAINAGLSRQAAYLKTHRVEINGVAVIEARMHIENDTNALQVLTGVHGWVNILPGDKVVQYKHVVETPDEQEIFYNEIFAEQEEPEVAPNEVAHRLAEGLGVDHYKLHQLLVRYNARVVINDGWIALAPMEYLRLALAIIHEL